jgi:hypothetical protein
LQQDGVLINYDPAVRKQILENNLDGSFDPTFTGIGDGMDSARAKTGAFENECTGIFHCPE